MSDHIPDPEANNEFPELDLSQLHAEEIPPLTGDFATPKPEKRKWWQTKREDKPRARAEKKPPKPMPPAPRGGLKAALEKWYMGIGITLMPFDPHCGKTIIDNAESCAEAMDDWARTNPKIRRVLLQMVNASAVGAVLTAHAPILMAVMTHHIPAIREKQERMAGDVAEMFARMAAENRETGDETE